MGQFNYMNDILVAIGNTFMLPFFCADTENPAVQPVSGVLRIMEGSNATVRVYVSGYPLVTSDKIRWYQPNGSEILEDEVMFENERRSFVMSNVQASYAGLYLCQITTSYGNSSTSIQVEVYGKMTFDLIKWGHVSLCSNFNGKYHFYVAAIRAKWVLLAYYASDTYKCMS